MEIAAVGIDLGTTYSAVAWLDAANKSAMIPNSEGDLLTPTAVFFSDRSIVVGKEAKKRGPFQLDRYAEAVKRDMGNPVYARPIRGRFLPPEAIQAYVLRRLKADIAGTIARDFRVVIAVPAFFDDPRRKATVDAGIMAGFDVLDIVNEPTAAALAFGEQLGYLTREGDVRSSEKVLVYDLGGGTFDVTVVELRPGDIRTLATDGDVRLGGRDWDQRLADHISDRFVQEHRDDPRDNPVVFQKMMVEVEEAKRTLSARSSASIVIDHAGTTKVFAIERQLFEGLTEDLLARTAFTTRAVLTAAGLNWSDLSRTLLCGGATRMPAVAQLIEKLSGRPPERITNPDEAVARGAAIYCGYRQVKGTANFKVTNVSSHSLGVLGIDSQTGRKRNAILIPRNTALPAKRTREFVTKRAGQPSISVKVLEGETNNPDGCSAIGWTVVSDLPPHLPAGWPVKVTYSYGENGRLTAHAAASGTGRETKLELQRENGLTSEQLSRWRKILDTSSQDDKTEQFFEEALCPVEKPARGDGDLTYAELQVPEECSDSAAAPPDDESGYGDVVWRLRRAPVHWEWIVRIAGHILFSSLGLVIGYYVLCWLNPGANFLHLDLPGLNSEVKPATAHGTPDK